jgi:simple sugar transport system permease protein
LILGALAGLLCERSGIVNIGIEGQMLLGAFMGYMVNVWTGSLAMAVGASLITGGLLGLLLAYTSITLKINQVIGGTVLNILATGLTGYFYTVGLTTSGKLTTVALGPLAEIPLIGPVLFNNGFITYSAFILVFVLQIVLYHTPWGLRTRAVGEHPHAADTLGINVIRTRYINTAVAGAIAGLAGGFLTLEAVGSFERMMTNGRGFIALAVMIFGNWTPLGAWGAALLFGFATAMQTQLNFMGVDIPHQFVGMLPYLLTIIVVAGVVGRTRPPAAEGEPFEKE